MSTKRRYVPSDDDVSSSEESDAQYVVFMFTTDVSPMYSKEPMVSTIARRVTDPDGLEYDLQMRTILERMGCLDEEVAVAGVSSAGFLAILGYFASRESESLRWIIGKRQGTSLYVRIPESDIGPGKVLEGHAPRDR